MKHRLILFQIFLISLFLCSCIQAQQPDPSPNHAADETITRKSVQIKFQRPKPASRSDQTTFSFPFQFSSEKNLIPMGISTDTSAIWIKSDFYSELKGASYQCSESESCQGEENNLEISFLDGWGTLVQEQVSFGGLTLPDLGLFIADRFEGAPDYIRNHPAVLGLDLTRANPKVPTIYETLKSEGFIEEPILAISLKNSYEGELIFGGYPNNKTKADFKFVQFVEEEYPEVRKSFVPIKGIGYGSPAGGLKAYPDFEIPWIGVSQLSSDKLNDFIDKQGLGISFPFPQGVPQIHPDGFRPVKCKAIDALDDLVIEFAGFTLRVPASAYVIRTKGFYYDKNEESREEGCFLAVAPAEYGENEKIFLGQPFFKAYDVIFDSETNSIGFSQKYAANVESPSRSYFPYALLIMGLAGLVIFGFCFAIVAKKFRRPYEKFSGEGRNIDESPSSEVLPYQVEVGEPVQMLPYQGNFGGPMQNLPYRQVGGFQN